MFNKFVYNLKLNKPQMFLKKKKINLTYKAIFSNIRLYKSFKKKNPSFFLTKKYRTSLFKIICAKKKTNNDENMTYDQYMKSIWRNINKPSKFYKFLDYRSTWSLSKANAEKKFDFKIRKINCFFWSISNIKNVGIYNTQKIKKSFYLDFQNNVYKKIRFEKRKTLDLLLDRFKARNFWENQKKTFLHNFDWKFKNCFTKKIQAKKNNILKKQQPPMVNYTHFGKKKIINCDNNVMFLFKPASSLYSKFKLKIDYFNINIKLKLKFLEYRLVKKQNRGLSITAALKFLNKKTYEILTATLILNLKIKKEIFLIKQDLKKFFKKKNKYYKETNKNLYKTKNLYYLSKIQLWLFLLFMWALLEINNFLQNYEFVDFNSFLIQHLITQKFFLFVLYLLFCLVFFKKVYLSKDLKKKINNFFKKIIYNFFIPEEEKKINDYIKSIEDRPSFSNHYDSFLYFYYFRTCFKKTPKTILAEIRELRDLENAINNLHLKYDDDEIKDDISDLLENEDDEEEEEEDNKNKYEKILLSYEDSIKVILDKLELELAIVRFEEFLLKFKKNLIFFKYLKKLNKLKKNLYDFNSIQFKKKKSLLLELLRLKKNFIVDLLRFLVSNLFEYRSNKNKIKQLLNLIKVSKLIKFNLENNFFAQNNPLYDSTRALSFKIFKKLNSHLTKKKKYLILKKLSILRKKYYCKGSNDALPISVNVHLNYFYFFDKYATLLTSLNPYTIAHRINLAENFKKNKFLFKKINKKSLFLNFLDFKSKFNIKKNPFKFNFKLASLEKPVLKITKTNLKVVEKVLLNPEPCKAKSIFDFKRFKKYIIKTFDLTFLIQKTEDPCIKNISKAPRVTPILMLLTLCCLFYYLIFLERIFFAYEFDLSIRNSINFKYKRSLFTNLDHYSILTLYLQVLVDVVILIITFIYWLNFTKLNNNIIYKKFSVWVYSYYVILLISWLQYFFFMCEYLGIMLNIKLFIYLLEFFYSFKLFLLFNVERYVADHTVFNSYALFLLNLIILFFETINFAINIYFSVIINLLEVFMRYLELDYFEQLPTFYFNSPYSEKTIEALEAFMSVWECLRHFIRLIRTLPQLVFYSFAPEIIIKNDISTCQHYVLLLDNFFENFFNDSYLNVSKNNFFKTNYPLLNFKDKFIDNEKFLTTPFKPFFEINGSTLTSFFEWVIQKKFKENSAWSLDLNFNGSKLSENNLTEFVSTFDLQFYDFNRIKEKNLVEINSKHFSNKYRITNTTNDIINNFMSSVSELNFIDYCKNKNLFIFSFEKNLPTYFVDLNLLKNSNTQKLFNLKSDFTRYFLSEIINNDLIFFINDQNLKSASLIQNKHVDKFNIGILKKFDIDLIIDFNNYPSMDSKLNNYFKDFTLNNFKDSSAFTGDSLFANILNEFSLELLKINCLSHNNIVSDSELTNFLSKLLEIKKNVDFFFKNNYETLTNLYVEFILNHYNFFKEDLRAFYLSKNLRDYVKEPLNNNSDYLIENLNFYLNKNEAVRYKIENIKNEKVNFIYDNSVTRASLYEPLNLFNYFFDKFKNPNFTEFLSNQGPEVCFYVTKIFFFENTFIKILVIIFNFIFFVFTIFFYVFFYINEVFLLLVHDSLYFYRLFVKLLYKYYFYKGRNPYNDDNFD